MRIKPRISSLLKKCSLIKGDMHFSPVNAGASGAVVLSCNDKYIVKYAHSSIIDEALMNQFRNECAFYKRYAGRLDFLPEVVYQTTNDDETLLVLKKYDTIPPQRWDSALQKKAMELCARINALKCAAYSTHSWLETETELGRYAMIESYENWKKLCDKFPTQMDVAVLKDMYEDFYKIAAYADELPIPNTFCHGDFNPPNFLLDRTQLLVCDWQYTHIGKGIGAVAFFCDRGSDQGLTIDRKALIACYSKALHENLGVTVTPDTLTRYADISGWLVTFRFSAEYLQDSDSERVARIYNDMVEKYMTFSKLAAALPL
ncbi:MAG: aminoglycoside phosphotransferase family protein [Defluviitaleaceae bacterium]|nr:aminoglycoside phosphotransferase family protein [Defluviitaleaceae bacterium]